MDVFTKLFAFTLAMVVLPIGSYFMINAYYGSSIVAAGIAAAVANLVLVGYIVVALREGPDESETEKKKE